MHARSFLTVFIAVSLSAGGNSVLAQEADSGLTFSLSNGAGSLGARLQPELRINNSFGLRLPIGIGQTDNAQGTEDILSFGESTRGGVGLLADYYPFETGLRVGGGLVASGGSFSLPEADLEAEDSTLTQTLSAIPQDNEGVSDGFIRPMVTMGYSGVFSQLALDVDLGVMVDPARLSGAQDADTLALDATDSSDTDVPLAGLEALGVSPFLKLGAKLSF